MHGCWGALWVFVLVCRLLVVWVGLLIVNFVR